MTDDPIKQKRARTWRRVRLAILAGILVLLVAYIAIDWYAGRRLEDAIARFEQRYGALGTSVAAPDVPAADNRAKMVRAAAALVVVPSPAIRSVMGRFGATNGPAPQTADLQPFVDANAASLRLASEVKLRHQSSWDIDYDKTDPSVLPLANTRTLADAVYAKALIDLEKGRLDDAAQGLVDALAVTAAFREEPILIAQLVRIGIGYHPLDVLQRMLAATEPSPATLKTLAAWLAENREPDGMRGALLGEARYMNARFAEAEGGRATGSSGGGLGAWLGPLSRPRRPFMRLARARYLDAMSHLLDAQSGPRPRPPSPTPPTPRWWSPVDRLIGSFLPSLERTLGAGDDFSTRLACAELSVALHRYRVEHGGYPDDLTALVPAYLPRLPLDMFTGKPPVYTHQAGGFTIRASRSANDSPLHRPVPEWTSTGGAPR